MAINLLDEFKKDLETAIAMEEYERAAFLRDEIKKMQKETDEKIYFEPPFEPQKETSEPQRDINSKDSDMHYSDYQKRHLQEAYKQDLQKLNIDSKLLEVATKYGMKNKYTPQDVARIIENQDQNIFYYEEEFVRKHRKVLRIDDKVRTTLISLALSYNHQDIEIVLYTRIESAIDQKVINSIKGPELILEDGCLYDIRSYIQEYTKRE